ncbi:MAG: LysM peptidoglycan-binding domain-containing protein [Oscillospiraceae bacterium]|jgi:LysM repeat protein|nr:LysM peptidoglycan-binding domain-containing protein [Oscillospiraceae bacterium]
MSASNIVTFPTLREGSAGLEVLILQQYLNLHGLFPSVLTKSFGETTTEAVKKFQQDQGLIADGIVGKNTWEALETTTDVSGGFPPAPLSRLKPILKQGSTGVYVEELQKQLKELDYYDGNVTGKFDQATGNAVTDFQISNKLVPNGIVGDDTWNALYYLYSPLSNCSDVGGGDNGGNEGDYIIYYVQSGDNLWAIARRFNTTVDAIKALNNLTSDNLDIGQVLKIPTSGGGTTPTPPDTSYTTYVVQSGDNLWAIARRFNTTVDAIKALNNLTSNNLDIGQVLKIPNSSYSDNYQLYSVYIVEPNDTLCDISRKYSITADKIRALNSLTNDSLSIGQILRLPNPKNKSIPKSYTVKPNDTLNGVSKKYGITIEALKAFNNLKDDIINIGQILIFPDSSNTLIKSDSNSSKVYTVKSGDSLWLIAKRYNTTVDELKRINNLKKDLIIIGQELIVPLD